MKVISINFVKEADIPQRSRDTEASRFAEELGKKIKTLPAGQGLSLKVSGAQKWHRYALQKRLQKAGHKVLVSLDEKEGVIFVRKVNDKDK